MHTCFYKEVKIWLYYYCCVYWYLNIIGTLGEISKTINYLKKETEMKNI